MADRTPVIDGSRRTDLVLALLVLLFSGAVLFSGLPPVQIWGVLALTVLQLPSVLLRRFRPRAALLVYAVPAALGYLAGIPSQPIFWAVLGFALLRSPGRAAGYLALVLVGTVSMFGLGTWLRDGTTPGFAAGAAIGLGLTVGVYAAIGGTLGRVTRTARAREADRRRAEDAERLATALAAERTRIADDVGSGVLEGLRRLVAGTAVTTAPSPAPDVDALAAQARAVLAGMRRALTALREPPPGTGPAPPGDRAGFPAPTRSGLAMAAALGLSAAAVSLLPLRPTGQLGTDRMLPLLDVAWDRPAVVALLGVQVLTLGWWRSAPATAFLAGTAAAIGTGALGGTNAIVETTWMVLAYGLGVGAPVLRSGLLTAAGTLAVLAGYLTIPADHDQLAMGSGGIVLGYLFVPVLWLVGVRRRGHRVQAEADRQARARAAEHRAREAERLRVARELHDVVAHHVSAISVQAGAATVTGDPAVRAAALAHIAESGRRIGEALPQLDGLTPDPGGVALTADGLDRLTGPVRDAGVPVTAEVHGPAADPAGDAELFAQRIVTEALTNVVRHAGPSATRVRLEHTPDAVDVRIDDDGPVAGHRPYRSGSGLGLVGMRERAELLGGWVRTGTGPDGGWSVRAHLPRAAGLLRAEETPAPISSAATTRPPAVPS